MSTKNLPTPQDIIAFLTSRAGRASKAELARKFGIKGNDRIGLKNLIKDMLNRGIVHQGSFRSICLPDAPKKPSKDIIPSDRRRGGAKDLGTKDKKPNPRLREGDNEEKSNRFVGLYRPLRVGGGMVDPVSRKEKHPVLIPEGKTMNAASGDFVLAEFEARQWEITEILAREGDAGMVSLMAIKTMDIPDVFPDDVLAETKGITVPPLGNRTDLRSISLITIDGADARDFDDAVWAESDGKDGWNIIVAIADVSHYVRPGSALDREAFLRGNSVYFPDRVVPMLPEALSNDLCSLRPHEERACMAAHMRVNAEGNLIDVKILRGLMKSAARLTYDEVQQALDGHPNDKTQPIAGTLLKQLYGAYKTLEKARFARGAVELDLPERKVSLVDGVVQDIVSRPRWDSHKLIEELMILANVAVASALEERNQELLYRIHAKPDNTRWAATREFLVELGLRPKYSLSPSPQDLKDLLASVEGKDEAPLVNDIVLRTMSQAQYSPENVGHFGLALEKYAHFTSPIRRYSDLIVHRALIRAFKLGDDGLTDSELKRLPHIGEFISDRERVAQSAERETIDRYIALFLQDKVGATFSARISGVTHFGIFVNIEPMGADGLIPVRTLPQDFYIFDEKRHSLTGRRSGLKFTLAMPLTVRLVEVDAATGRLLVEMLPGAFGDADEKRAQRRFQDDSRHRDRDRRSAGNRPRRTEPDRRSASDGPKRGPGGGQSTGKPAKPRRNDRNQDKTR